MTLATLRSSTLLCLALAGTLEAAPAPVRTEGGLVADLVACIGTIDIVLGEVDR